jgi:Cu(I)/Ag(I) efflux system membrane fusion protein
VGTSGLVAVSGGGGGAAEPGVHHAFGEVCRKELDRALKAYELVRTELAADRIDGLAKPMAELVAALKAARTAEASAPKTITEHFTGALAAAYALQKSTEIDTARKRFGEVSKHLVALTAADPVVRKGMHLFECSMTKGYNKWLQPQGSKANPYQGTKMLTCGSELEWTSEAPADGAGHVHGGDEIDHYTCPMDTWVKQKKAGKCPVCGMDLVPVTKEEMKTGVMRIDHRRRQLIGLRLAKIRKQKLTLEVRAVGKVAYDQSRLVDVTLKYDGFINRLLVNKPGQKVRRGQTLFTIYSPQLYNAQQEYLLALAQRKMATTEGGRRRAEALVTGARQRLRLWDINNWQLKHIAKRNKPIKYLSVPSPASGYVVDKELVEGAAVKTGQRLFRIAGLDRIWVEADVYENDLPYIKKGQSTKITLSHIPGKTFEGKVAFIYPYLEKHARTTRVRIELPNKGTKLKPDMYANVLFEVDLGEKLAVPEAAVIYSGPRRIVFVDMGGDRLRPKLIEVGAKANGFFEVRSGLSPGDNVVISGNFLLSAESRLKAATGLW